MNLQRFDRLPVKLFLAIAGTIAGLTFVTYLVFTWTFERGFVQYVNRADEARLELMTDRLADAYAREGGWASIAADGDRWMAMSRDALGLPSSAEPGERRELPLTIDPRLLLFDGNRARLIGRAEAAAGAVLSRSNPAGASSAISATCRGSTGCSPWSACTCAASTRRSRPSRWAWGSPRWSSARAWPGG